MLSESIAIEGSAPCVCEIAFGTVKVFHVVPPSVLNTPPCSPLHWFTGSQAVPSGATWM